MATASPKHTCTIFEQESCIQDLKELVGSLTDRDMCMKNHLRSIKSILNDKTLKTDSIKIKQIKQILKDGQAS